LTERPDSPGEPLARRVFRGAAWLFGSFALSKLTRVAVMLVIAALLSPEAYGIITLSYVSITVVWIINEFGIWQTVVQRSNLDERFLKTAFTANVLVGFVVTTGLLLLAPWIAQLYGEPQITLMLSIMGLTLIPEAIAYVPDGLLRKELKFKSRALPEVVSTFLAAIVTIGLVLLGVGALSFAVGFVAESLVRSAWTVQIAVRETQWRPRLKLSLPYLTELISYGKHILGTELVKYTSSNIDFFIVGSILGAGPLGFYALAFNLANYPVTNFALVLSKIVFPTFATLQEDIEHARCVYLKTVQLLAMVVIPMLAVLALLAAPLILEFLGGKWQPAVLPLQAITIAGIARAISVPGSDMLRAIGLPSVPFKVGLVEGLVLLGALLLVAHQGIAPVAITVALILSLASWVITWAACRALGIGVWELGLTLLPGIVLAASGTGAILFLELLDLSSLPDALEPLVLLAAAGVAMALCMVTVYRNSFQEIMALASTAKPR
jgi:O-antigen/teichoic acid export membrane protein